MSTPEKKDLLVGRALISDLMQNFCTNEAKLDSPEAKLRMYLGATCALAGIMQATLGKASAVLALRAAIEALEGVPE
jgi:hypothetical protein